MDSIDPGSYLATLMGSAAKPAADAHAAARSNGADLDRQILALAATPSADTQGGPSPEAQAAKSAYDAAQKQPQKLRFGPWTTPITVPHWLDNTLGGMGGRALQLGQWAGQTVGMQPDPISAAVAQQLQTGTAGKIGSFIADTALTAPIGGAATSGLAKLGTVGARAAGNTLGRAAVQGAVQGAATAPPGERLQGAAMGAALSPVLPLAGSAVRKVATGLTRTPEAQALLNRGVQLTPGQMNPTGKVVNRLEQAFTALPVVGGAIANARARGPVQYARSMVQDALAPGQKLTSTSHDFNEWIADAQQGYSEAYDKVFNVAGGGHPVAPKITTNAGDVPLADAFRQLADTPRLGLVASQRQAMGQELQGRLKETLAVAQKSGGLQADDLQQLRSALRDAARDVSPIDNASRAQKSFWNAAQGTVTQALESQLPADAAQALRTIDSQYSKFAIVRDVARQLKDKPGGPTPNQFSQAIAKATAPNDYAAGGGWNRDLSKAAQSVFTSTVPHTGLTGIGSVLPVVEGAGAALLTPHHPIAALGAAGALGGLYGAYTRPGLRALAGQTGWQQALQRQGARVSPAAREAIGRYSRAGLLSGPLSQQSQGGLLESQ